MGRAKEIIVKVIPAKIANEFVKKHHYSGKYARSTTLSMGCFLDNKLHGVMQWGNPINKEKVLPLVDTGIKEKNQNWNSFLELNRMAFDDYLPKNSESRCLSIAIKLIKKNAPHIKWLLSFSDGTQSGDGTIYRASGWSLTQINTNKSIWEMPNGDKVASLVFGLKYGYDIESKNNLNGRYGKKVNESVGDFFKRVGAKPLDGFQLRYIYLIDKTCKITVPILPFSKIDEMGAGMYKGEKISLSERKKVLYLQNNLTSGDSVIGSTSDNQSEGDVQTDLTAQIKNK